MTKRDRTEKSPRAQDLAAEILFALAFVGALLAIANAYL